MLSNSIFTSFNDLLACATCMGHVDDPAMKAANMAILFMLVLLIPVFGGFISLIVTLGRREKMALQNQEISNS